jgi:hypothetical protein
MELDRPDELLPVLNQRRGVNTLRRGRRRCSRACRSCREDASDAGDARDARDEDA